MHRAILFLGLALLLAAGAAVAVTPPGGRTASWDDYRLILTRNIFARDRSAPSRDHAAVTPPAPRSTDHQLVLTGVGVRGDVRAAFFEDSRTGETQQAAVGGTLDGGTLVSVSLDSVEYRCDGVTRRISVGESLAGVAVALSGPDATTRPATAASPDAHAGPGDATDKSANDIVERMRQRRLQEQKR